MCNHTINMWLSLGLTQSEQGRKKKCTCCFSPNSFLKSVEKDERSIISKNKYRKQLTELVNPIMNWNQLLKTYMNFSVAEDKAWGTRHTLRPDNREGTPTGSSFTAVFPQGTAAWTLRHCGDSAPLWVPAGVSNVREISQHLVLRKRLKAASIFTVFIVENNGWA